MIYLKTKINQILSKIDKENKICYLMGDFNIDLLKSESCDFAAKFFEQLITSSFMPLILKPTRITQHTATLIDNIFTNDIEALESSSNGIIFSDFSDHLPIVRVRNYKSQKETIQKMNLFIREILMNQKLVLSLMKSKVFLGKRLLLTIMH